MKKVLNKVCIDCVNHNEHIKLSSEFKVSVEFGTCDCCGKRYIIVPFGRFFDDKVELTPCTEPKLKEIEDPIKEIEDPIKEIKAPIKEQKNITVSPSKPNVKKSTSKKPNKTEETIIDKNKEPNMFD
jgi:hypothetical protein